MIAAYHLCFPLLSLSAEHVLNLLGIDIGTTGTKTLLFSENGQLMGRAYPGYETRTPQVGYAEQDPKGWWHAVTGTVRELCRDPAVARQVTAISLSLQGSTMMSVDGNDHPLRPAFVWSNHRCTQEFREFLQEVGSTEIMYRLTGWKLKSGLPALAIRWMRNHEPEIFAKTAMFMEVADLACVGAAIQAGIGCGIYADAEDGYRRSAVLLGNVYGSTP